MSATGNSAQTPLLEVTGLRKTYRRRRADALVAVEDAGFSVMPGSCLGLVGPSGSGKSTIARLVLRLEEPDAGRIVLDGHDIAHMRGRALRRAQGAMQAVFQNPEGSFDPRFTLGASIAEGLRNCGMGRQEARARTTGLLELCGLSPELAGRFPHQVSGGQCQRAAIARAVATGPRLLVCDEPTSALDVTVQRRIVDLLDALRRELGMALVFICHDIALVAGICDTVAVLDAGRVVEQGPTDQVLSHPQSACARALVDAAL